MCQTKALICTCIKHSVDLTCLINYTFLIQNFENSYIQLDKEKCITIISKLNNLFISIQSYISLLWYFEMIIQFQVYVILM